MCPHMPLESSVNGKHEFCNKKVILSDMVSEGLLVASGCDEKLLQTCGTDTLIAKKDLISGIK